MEGTGDPTAKAPLNPTKALRMAKKQDVDVQSVVGSECRTLVLLVDTCENGISTHWKYS